MSDSGGDKKLSAQEQAIIDMLKQQNLGNAADGGGKKKHAFWDTQVSLCVCVCNEMTNKGYGTQRSYSGFVSLTIPTDTFVASTCRGTLTLLSSQCLTGTARRFPKVRL